MTQSLPVTILAYAIVTSKRAPKLFEWHSQHSWYDMSPLSPSILKLVNYQVGHEPLATKPLTIVSILMVRHSQWDTLGETFLQGHSWSDTCTSLDHTYLDVDFLFCVWHSWSDTCTSLNYTYIDVDFFVLYMRYTCMYIYICVYNVYM